MEASECKCIKCGKQAVCFWPAFDPDIKSNPYCRKCKTDIDIKLMLEMSKMPPFKVAK